MTNGAAVDYAEDGRLVLADDFTWDRLAHLYFSGQAPSCASATPAYRRENLATCVGI